MKQLKPISSFIAERKRQDVCSGCGKSIENPEKECPTCGAFPHKAYHERAAAKTLGISKWLQNAPVMQPNQKLSENTITKLGDF
jgi:predicted amidophosphoribosyltransferase